MNCIHFIWCLLTKVLWIMKNNGKISTDLGTKWMEIFRLISTNELETVEFFGIFSKWCVWLWSPNFHMGIAFDYLYISSHIKEHPFLKWWAWCSKSISHRSKSLRDRTGVQIDLLHEWANIHQITEAIETRRVHD